ncbi:hypothetical protein BJ994_002244 [Arthrobacter pigmenti]|uniref:Transmembrane protein n=1 Tax=Arthrobacter pigmenti TaxID=271432 RepID=A0A846RIQ5_9MICC|nr:hypothetical protein [Arthrobacter pigmenti]NJC23168.1 hypothetical protein [Arthrobacter pigmenti]
MQIYSNYPVQRTRQILADVLAVTIVLLAVLLARAAAAAVTAFAEFGRGMEEAGAGFRNTMDDAAVRIGGVPIIGDQASAPFREAADAGAFLVSAGQDQQDAVALAASAVGWMVALVPLAVLARIWLVRRAKFIRQSSRVRSLMNSPAGREILAFRALNNARPAELLGLSDDPVGNWRRGDPATVSALSQLAAQRAGVKAG